MIDGKTHPVINNRLFKSLGQFNDQVLEVEFANYEIEHKELFVVGLRWIENVGALLQLFHKICDTDKY